jgi:lipoate-protein ligase A
MHLLDLTLPTLAENLALEEALLAAADAGQGGECLRFWEWPELAVVLGASGVVRAEVFVERCAAEGVPLQRRASGGGTVVLGPGCLNYALVLSLEQRPELWSVTASYQVIMNRIAQALQPLVRGQSVAMAGSSDLVWGERKFSGNAQRRGRNYLLHHGTLLYQFALERIPQLLPLPPRQPEYRAGRPHQDFVGNLPASASAMKTALAAAWQAQATNPPWPQERVARLVAEKYSRPEWIHRR